jgi:ring-1,2-phenylacetyl-CoA epoxidase subunit PaaD
MQTTIDHTIHPHIWAALETVNDPEIPVISVVDMGIITNVEVINDKAIVTMTPTFVGCPAIDVMKKQIHEAVTNTGYKNVQVNVDFETRWNSDMMSEDARTKLEKFGLAPPVMLNDEELSEEVLNRVRCPHCHSTDTTLRSTFGSTLCRAIRFCFNCKQGFEQFKPVS